MSFGRMASTFGYLFHLFQFYWNFCRDFENQIINTGQFLVLQSRVFEKLSQEWKQFKWDETELDWICSRIAEKRYHAWPIKILYASNSLYWQCKKLLFFRIIYIKWLGICRHLFLLESFLVCFNFIGIIVKWVDKWMIYKFFLLTSRVFLELKKLWEVNKWDLKELEEICGNIHHHDSAYDSK